MGRWGHGMPCPANVTAARLGEWPPKPRRLVCLMRFCSRRGDDAVRIDTDLEASEAAIVCLTAAVERLDSDRRRD